MGRGSLPSRRTLLHALLGSLSLSRIALAGPTPLPTQAPGADGVAGVLAGFRRTSVHHRRYRATATITTLGIKIFGRAGVGGGYAAVETGSAGDSTGVALQFSAGSWPDRAAGLNRFGILREAVTERSGNVDLAFAGFITSSKEESLAEARKALRAAEGGVPVTLAWGSARASRSYANAAHTLVSPSFTWTKSEDVLADLLREVAEEPPVETHTAHGASGFLGAMRRAGLSREPSFRSAFVHSGKLYELRTKWESGPQSELEGEIHNEKKQTTAEFQARYQSGDASGLPIRFDYHARSFLRLTFEADPAGTQPIPLLMAE